jgi:predicted ribosomally synthesized peptide with SipW-like signal peptide
MKKILLSVLTIALVAAVTVGATQALFSDTEESTGNTFTAGSLDLKMNGNDGPFTNTFSASNMVPGQRYTAGVVSLSNTGSVDGILGLKILNPVSNENDLIEPELSDGDVAGLEIDPSGYNANTGDGELWDQTTMKVCLETGAGSHSSNGVCDWDDTILYSNDGTPGNDYSSYYSVPLGTDFAADNSVIIPASGSKNLVFEVFFVDDASSWWWGGLSGLTNNMAMTDSMTFDVEFSLTQVTP